MFLTLGTVCAVPVAIDEVNEWSPDCCWYCAENPSCINVPPADLNSILLLNQVAASGVIVLACA